MLLPNLHFRYGKEIKEERHLEDGSLHDKFVLTITLIPTEL